MKFCRIFFLLLLACGLALPLRAETVTKVAAVVNDQIITTHQLEKAVASYTETDAGGRTLSAAERARVRGEVLSKLIEQSLVQQKIDELGLKVGDEELEKAIEDVQKQNQLTRDQLIAALEAQGMSFADYKASLAKQILRFKLIGREVQSKVEVTSQDVRDYFRDHIDDYREAPYMRISRITFPVPPGATRAQRRQLQARAEQARERLQAGASLDEVLAGLADEGLAEGGDMGVFKEGELTPVFDRAIRDLRQGETSNVVQGPNGALYVFKVDVREPGSIRQFDAVKGEIEKTLLEQNREQRFQEWAKGLRKEAYIDIRI